jgi:CRISPR-associated protein Cmr3
VFVRDGRPFDAADDTAAQAVRPGPSTIAGAVGRALGGEPDEVRGPVLARRGGVGWEPYFPVPADLAGHDGIAYRLVPGDPPGATDLGNLLHRTPRGDSFRYLLPPPGAEQAGPLSGWIGGDTLARYLKGELPADGGSPAGHLDLIEDDPMLPEPRIGLARDETRRARTGFLYQASHLRMEEGWGFLAQCVFDKAEERPPSGPVPLGGRGRLADVDLAEVGPFSIGQPGAGGWPARPEGSIGRRVLVYVATPALWRTGWRLPLPEDAWLVAAATGDPEPVATVKPGRGWEDTRVLRWAVPAGSVYLVEFATDEAGARWAKDVHGRAYRGPGDDERLRTAGFGVLLTGVWK